MALTESTQQIISSQEFVPDPMIMNIQVIAKEALSTSGVQFSLMMDTKMCQRIMRELSSAIVRLNELLAEINNFKLDNSLHDFMCMYRWKLNKYSIMKCDCYWQTKDEDLDKTMLMLENCYNVITHKNNFVVGDVLYVIKVLETVIFNFERKISQLEEIF